MTVPAVYARAYFEQPRFDLHRFKRAPEAVIACKIAELDPPAPYLAQRWTNQRRAFLAALKCPKQLNLGDMGTGKTATCLDLIRYHRDLQVAPALALVPNGSNVYDWLDQARAFHPSLLVGAVSDALTAKQKQQRFEDQHLDLVVCTYAYLLSWCRRFGEARDGRVYQLPPRGRFGIIVADECTTLRTWDSKTSKTVRYLCEDAVLALGLTGTPLGRKPESLWSEFRAIDGGVTLGQTLSIYRAMYYREHQEKIKGKVPKLWWKKGKKQPIRMGKVTYRFQKKFAAAHLKRVRTGSIRYRLREIHDMPPKTEKVLRFDLTPEQVRWYRKSLSETRGGLGDGVGEATTGYYHHVRRLSAGALMAGDEVVPLKHNPRLELLWEVIQESEGRKRVVFFQYRASGDLAVAGLAERGHRAGVIDGRTRDRQAVLSAFKSGDLQTLMIQIQAGAFGLNLQAGSVCVFYELHPDPILIQQAKARIYRAGQTQHCLFYDIVGNFPADLLTQQTLKQSRDIRSLIMGGSVSLKDLEL